MPRSAFEVSTLLGVNTRQVSTIAVVSAGDRMFLGAGDGSLTAHECRGDTPNALKASSFECREVDSLRKGLSSDRRPVLDLLAVEAWRALLGLLDGQLTAYDMYTYRPLASVPSTRGASCFCVDEERRLVFVANKKRLQVLAWQAVSLAPRRDFPLPETPRSMALVPEDADGPAGSSGPKLVLALRKEYSVMDATTGALSPALLLSDRDQLDASASSMTSSISGLGGGGSSSHGVILPVPASSARGARVLLSSGSRGLLVDLVGRGHEERLTWTAPPLSVCLSTAFFVAALPRQVEVHDLASLAPLQTFDLPGATCMTTCPVGGGRGDLTYVATANSVNLLKLIPIEFQVETLAESGSYEDALSLCAMCKDMSVLGSVNVLSIHERYAYDLFSWGDYEGAVGHFLVAETPVDHVLSLFPSLAPPEFVPPGGSLQGPNTPKKGPTSSGEPPRQLTGVSRSRAASAVMTFLERHRPAILAAAEREDCQKADDAEDADGPAEASPAAGGEGDGGGSGNSDNDGKAGDTLVLLDTMLMSSYVQCSPPRHSALVELLSGPNRCSLAACAPLLAASGPSFIEALLCLYRGRGLHEDALALATEDRCVAPSSSSYSGGSGGGGGGWTAPQFRRWLAAYLRELRLSSEPAHRALVLRSVKPLLEADPALGLSVFLNEHRQATGLSHHGGFLAQRRVGVSRRAGGASADGRRAEAGLAPHDVVSFLKTITPSESGRANAETSAAATAAAAQPAKEGQAVPMTIPFTSGRALAVGYLQVLIDAAAGGGGEGGGGAREGEVTSALHDELAYLLMEGLLVEQGAAADRGQSSRRLGSSKNIAKDKNGLAAAYRQRLQLFLQTSEKYNPARLLSVIPSHFLEEHALLLSRLGRHEEVLHIYVRQLKNREMAEAYCGRIWERCESAAKAKSTAKRGAPADAATATPSPDEEVYLFLLKVYLQGQNKAGGHHPAQSKAGSPSSLKVSDDGVAAVGEEVGGLDEAVSLLERHFSRVDPVKVMALLPPSVPVSKLVPFLSSAVRHAEARRRSNQVTHQLCRADYVNVKFELIQLQGQVSRVPELSLASFPQLGTLLRTCPPVELTDPTADYGVGCIKHVFESFIVLQFDVTNRLRDQRLHNVLVKVECSDPDLYSIKTERHFPALPPHGSGSCYTVLARSPSAGGVGRGSVGGIGGGPSVLFMCELRFTSARIGSGGAQGIGMAESAYDKGGGFMEEYLLEDLELSPADLGE
ncbi:conserved unknown protein [Ectocarpus siliculosus]|uniref:CNH domain-containing protein n=1 Tax=Ectocarpus siliculosus TaxID=2880 RepID=D7G8R8_ECTSI|nr:conserved unknown protein [Ectocarpus siliculosus]|eukprot:CBJ28092.1 conserved unknown protein [Ectocarpus siliculosus]